MPASKLPFLKSKSIIGISRIFTGVGSIPLKLFPNITITLKQSGIADEYGITAREYLSICFFIAASLFLGFTAFLTFVLFIGKSKLLIIGPILGTTVAAFTYILLILYPKSIVNKRVKNLENNLLFALRTILVQIRSGVPIFNTFVSIANGDYGEISAEFRIVIEKVRAGESMIETLEELAMRNPSVYLRRAIWQLLNAIKSGSDVGENISNVIASLSKQQIVEIRKYQSTLNPLAMMYMMIAVIVPSLGITVMIIISTFPNMERIGDEQTFWILLLLVVFMQFIFMSVIRSRRPTLME